MAPFFFGDEASVSRLLSRLFFILHAFTLLCTPFLRDVLGPRLFLISSRDNLGINCLACKQDASLLQKINHLSTTSYPIISF